MDNKRKIATKDSFNEISALTRRVSSLPKEQKKILLANMLTNQLKALQLNGIGFAERLGKKPSEISKWLSGSHNFTIDTLFEIEEELGLTLINIERPLEVIKDSFKTYDYPIPFQDELNEISNDKSTHRVYNCKKTEYKVLKGSGKIVNSMN